MNDTIPCYYELPLCHASLEFISVEEECRKQKPYYYSGTLQPHQDHLRTNISFSPATVTLRDLRGFEDKLRLGVNGVQFIPSPADLSFDADANSLQSYLRRVADTIKNLTGAERCICYDYRV